MKQIALALFVFLSTGIFLVVRAQSVIDAEKAEAIREMAAGRYGEAIDLLNKYIAAKPQQADGYNLRGECYEKQQQFDLSVYDYRSAKKLEPNNKDIIANLNRATNTWYTILYNNIEGYKREIAINPNNPDNYLNIGKSYKNLGEWAVAEQWYDKYLTMTHASPDEIIRYSEILAKTNHIAKGWPILRRYCEEYPNDQRLWSRYGYFSLWLGKNQIAIEAFENALALKPFFKEAIDGLAQAKGKGYIYTVNDTSEIRNYNYGLPPVRQQYVYPIDKYYTILKKNPSDNDTRVKLVKALLTANRFEEASQQIQILESVKFDSINVAQLATQIDSVRTIVFRQRIEEYKAKLAADSSDKDAVLNLGQYYSKLQDYDSAIAVYSGYLVKNPKAKDVLYDCAQAEANNRNFFKAQDIITTLLKAEPNNLKYQLFMGQLDVWVSQNLGEAKNYLENVLAKEPNNLQALVAMSSLNMQQNDFVAAQNYLDKIKELSPVDPSIGTLQSAMTLNKYRFKQEQNYSILKQAETLYAEKKCKDALPKYEEFLKNMGPNPIIEKEYADVNVCAGHYQKAIDIYTNLLNAEYDFPTDYSRATAYYAMGDSVKALQEFQRLAKANPDDFNTHLYLGDSYLRMHDYDKALDVYEAMEDNMKLDSTQVAMVKQRERWVPPTGFRGILSSFPNYTLLTPYSSYYSDNQGTQNFIAGLRLDVGITTFLSLGIEGYRTALYSNNSFYYPTSVHLTSSTLRWDITIRLAEALTFGVDFGNTYYSTNYTQPIADVYLRSEITNKYLLYGIYSKMDASQVIYSPLLIATRINSNIFRAGGYYQTNSGVRIGTDFNYYTFSDSSNNGFNLSLRIGKYFFPNFMLGYEYYVAGFKFTSPLYYSPKSYSSHNIFADWDIIHDTSATVTLGGLMGFVANSNFILRQGYIAATVRLADRFTLQGRLSGGSSSFNVLGYSSFGASLTAYWAL
jgi:tetratricopeptide (TPR) repeat protein